MPKPKIRPSEIFWWFGLWMTANWISHALAEVHLPVWIFFGYPLGYCQKLSTFHWGELTDSVRFSPRHEWRMADRAFSEERLLLLWRQEMEQGSTPLCICVLFQSRILNAFPKILKAVIKWQETVTNSTESRHAGYRSDTGREINQSEACPNRLGAR